MPGEMPLPAAVLTVVEDQDLEAGKSFDLARETSIGRSDDNDIAIPDKAISRKHAEIYFNADAFLFETWAVNTEPRWPAAM
jgi:predicted component of type VI protein secretion system